eukprot:3944759-Alexandrium_andersonii.AAC.1
MPFPLVLVNVYAYQGSHQASEARERTRALLAAVFEELAAMPFAPFVIAGDLNAEISDLPIIEAMVEQQQLFDVAAMSELNGGRPPLTTCRAHGARDFKRRDYVLVHPAVLPWVKEVSLIPRGLDVHTP